MTVDVRPETPAARTARGRWPVAPGAGPKRSRSFLSVSRPWLLLAPALAVLAVLLLWPLARVVLISLQDYGLREIVSGKTNFVGFANYAEVFGNATLWTVALPNTVVLAILSVAGTVALGTLVAVLMANLGPV